MLSVIVIIGIVTFILGILEYRYDKLSEDVRTYAKGTSQESHDKFIEYRKKQKRLGVIVNIMMYVIVVLVIILLFVEGNQ